MTDLAERPTLEELESTFQRAKEARRFLAEFEEWLERVSPLPGMGGLTPSTHSRFQNVPQREAVLEILEEHPENAYRTRDIVKILIEGGMEFQTQTPVTSISSILSKAAEEGQVERRGRGFWSIAGTDADQAREHADDLPF